MTNAQVDKIISDAAKRGVVVSTLDASTFLGAKEMLDKTPDHKLARQVVEQYMVEFRTGVKSISFARFLLPLFETDDELRALVTLGGNK